VIGVVAERWLQIFIDLVKEKGCVTRRFIIDHLVNTHNTSHKQAERIADDIIESLVKRNIITRKGRGVYCWAGPP
jgi:predicted transcriptional regulator